MAIALIAGKGTLPLIFRKEAQRQGKRVVTVGIKGVADIDADITLPIGRVGALIDFLKREGAKSIVMLGKVEHNLLYSVLGGLDMTAFKIIRRAKDRRAESLLRAFIEYLEEEGFEFIDPRPYLGELLAPEGKVNSLTPGEDAMEDGIFGFPIAREIASLDVGQTITVKDRAVVSVEAMEGTQRTILRAGDIAGNGFRVIKVARKNQDFRIDVPAVGVDTLKAIKKAGGDALFLEAGKVFIVDREEFVRTADRLKIPVMGLC